MSTTTLHPVIGRLLQKRGLDLADKVQEYFSWDLKTLPDLTGMIDLDKATERLVVAIEKQERIGIYGDYDVDGTTSCALLFHFFKSLGIEVSLFQPSRFIEGYGIHNSSIDAALEAGVKVLVTVDCGISNVATAEYARDKLDLIITDHHHDGAPELPRAYAVVNPNRRDEPTNSPLKTLAGVGVAFALCVKLRTELMAKGYDVPSCYPLLQFVAVGTICDLAVMTSMNLRLSRHGLKLMAENPYPGLRAFFSPEELKVSMVPSEKIAFQMGPMINSKGRLDHPEKALSLLTAATLDEAREHIVHLEISNRDRRLIQAEVFDQAKREVIKKLNGDMPPINIVYQPEWHEGVVGIVASKLVETFEVPAIVLTNAEEKGIIKGSARSAGELNIYEALNECRDLFIKFGGHKMAAGLSMKAENLPAFVERMNEILKPIPAVIRTRQQVWDIEIGADEIDANLLRDLDRLEPFGNGNERPVFRMKGIKLGSYRVMKDAHVRWNFQSAKDIGRTLQGVSFNYLGKWNEPTPEEIFQRQRAQDLSIEFTLGINRWNGNETIQLMVNKVSL